MLKLIKDEVNVVDEIELLKILKQRNNNVYSYNIIEKILIGNYEKYAEIFYYLSLFNKVIYEKIYRDTFLHRNFNNFQYEESYYICEAIKIEFERENIDLYYILHIDFTANINKFETFQMLIVYFLERSNYKIREVLISSGCIKELFKIDLNNLKKKIFFIKFIKSLIILENKSIYNYIKANNLKKEINITEGCIMFFNSWLKNNEKINDIITITNKM